MKETGHLIDGCCGVEDQIIDSGEGDEGAVAGCRDEGDHMLISVVGLIDILAVQFGEVIERVVFQAVDPLRGHGRELPCVGGEVATVGGEGETGGYVGSDLLGDTQGRCTLHRF